MYKVTKTYNDFTITYEGDTPEGVIKMMSYDNVDDVDMVDDVEAEPSWIPWSGGFRPVDSGQDVEVEFRSGDVSRDSIPEKWRWEHDWGIKSRDIIAYRVWS